jgi:hypothetical protein
MRTAQDVTLGPWFGGLAENGVKRLGITLSRNPPESTNYLIAIRARILGYSAHLAVSAHDKMHRPHWQEAVLRPKSFKTQWKKGFIPAPAGVDENRARHPWPSLSEWRQKLMPQLVSTKTIIVAYLPDLSLHKIINHGVFRLISQSPPYLIPFDSALRALSTCPPPPHPPPGGF